jgi:hypothetical protein
MTPFVLKDISKERLDDVVSALQTALSNPALRSQSARAVQAHVWHDCPQVAAVLKEVRAQEEDVRTLLLEKVSALIYQFHAHAVHVTLARAGVQSDERVHAGSSLASSKNQNFDLVCLDAKERLYMLLNTNEWLQDFFRRFPQHFYENSFSFVENIPEKSLNVTVRIVGMGIAGTMALSGLAKHGIAVKGYEKRAEKGPRSTTSRYQNASWRAYDIAREMVDDTAYQHFLENRQSLTVTFDDGSTTIRTSDRVQIILGSAIQSMIDSARRYGAELNFACQPADYYQNDNDDSLEEVDIVALFCGTSTAYVAPGLEQALNIHSWPQVDSECRMWLRLQPSEMEEGYCTRGGQVGAEHWDYTIHSARDNPQDVQRILDNLSGEIYDKSLTNRLKCDAELTGMPILPDVTGDAQRSQAQQVLEHSSTRRFDYIFTNAPRNLHNLQKRAAATNVVLDGGYTVEVKLASRSIITATTTDNNKEYPELLQAFKTKLLVCGGDACVPPNPQAAYGATLACEAAGNLVRLAIGTGHVNSIRKNLVQQQGQQGQCQDDWIQQVEELKDLLALYYEAHSKSENYFQWVQTLICNLYSLPPFQEEM